MQISTDDYTEQVYKEKLKEHSALTEQILTYSVRRIDILIISVSGAGVYICLEALKFRIESSESFNPLLLKSGGLFFAMAIIVNLIGQWGAYYSSFYYKKATDLKIKEYDYKEIRESPEVSKYNRYAKVIVGCTKVTNFLSTACLITGLILVVRFVWATF